MAMSPSPLTITTFISLLTVMLVTSANASSALCNDTTYTILEAGEYSIPQDCQSSGTDAIEVAVVGASNVKVVVDTLTNPLTFLISESPGFALEATNAVIESVVHVSGDGPLTVSMTDSVISQKQDSPAFLAVATAADVTLTLQNVSTSYCGDLIYRRYVSGKATLSIQSSTMICTSFIYSLSNNDAIITIADSHLVSGGPEQSAFDVVFCEGTVRLTMSNTEFSGTEGLLRTLHPYTLDVTITSSTIELIGSAPIAISTESVVTAQLTLTSNEFTGSGWMGIAVCSTWEAGGETGTSITSVEGNTVMLQGSEFTMLEWPQMQLSMKLNAVTVEVDEFTLYRASTSFYYSSSGDHLVANDVRVHDADNASTPTSSGKQSCSGGGTRVCYNSIILRSAVTVIHMFASTRVTSNAEVSYNTIETIGSLEGILFHGEIVLTANFKYNAVTVSSGSFRWRMFLNATTRGDMLVKNNAVFSQDKSVLSSLCSGVSSSTATVVCGNTVKVMEDARLSKYHLLSDGRFGSVTLSQIVNLGTAYESATIAVLYDPEIASLTIPSGTSIVAGSDTTVRLAQRCLVSGAVSVTGVTVSMASTSGRELTAILMEDMQGTTSLSITSNTMSLSSTYGITNASMCLGCEASSSVTVKSNAITMENSATAEAAIVGVVSTNNAAATTTVSGNQLSAAPLNQNPSLSSATCPSGSNICGNTVKLRGTETSILTVCKRCGAAGASRLFLVKQNYIGSANFQGDLLVNLCEGCVAWNSARTHVLNHQLSIKNATRFQINFGGLNVSGSRDATVRWNQITAAPANVSHLGASWFGDCSHYASTMSMICGNSVVVDFGYVVQTQKRFHTGVVQAVNATFCTDCHKAGAGTLEVVDNVFQVANLTGAGAIFCDRCSSSSHADALLLVQNNTAITKQVELYSWIFLIKGVNQTFHARTQLYDEAVIVCRGCNAKDGGTASILDNAFEHIRLHTDNTSSPTTKVPPNALSGEICRDCGASNGGLLQAFHNRVVGKGQFGYGNARFCNGCVVDGGTLILVANEIAYTYTGSPSHLFTFPASVTSHDGLVFVIDNAFVASSSNAEVDTPSLSLCEARRQEAVAGASFVCGNVMRMYDSASVEPHICIDCVADTNTSLIVITNNSMTVRQSGGYVNSTMCDGCEGNIQIYNNSLNAVASTLLFAFSIDSAVLSNETVFAQFNNTVIGSVGSANVTIAGFASDGALVVCDNVLSAFSDSDMLDHWPIATQLHRCLVPTTASNLSWSYSKDNTLLIQSSSTFVELCTGCRAESHGVLHVVNNTMYASSGSTTLRLCQTCAVGGQEGIPADVTFLNNELTVINGTSLTVTWTDDFESYSKFLTVHNEVFHRADFDAIPLTTREERFFLCRTSYYGNNNGGLVCGNLVRSIHCSDIRVTLANLALAADGDAVQIHDNVVGVLQARSLNIAWCYRCTITGAHLQIFRNFGFTNGTTSVTVRAGGTHVHNQFVFYLTNNNFVATSESTLTTADAAFVDDRLSQAPPGTGSYSTNNTAVSLLMANGKMVMCENCQVDTFGHIVAASNEARYKNTTSGSVTLCADCCFYESGMLDIYNNVMDTLGVSASTGKVFTNLKTRWTPLRVHDNVWHGFNATTSDSFTDTPIEAACPVQRRRNVHRAVCGNLFQFRDAVAVTGALCEVLDAGSLVEFDANLVQLADATDATIYGCVGCNASPLKGTSSTVGTGPAGSSGAGGAPQTVNATAVTNNSASLRVSSSLSGTSRSATMSASPTQTLDLDPYTLDFYSGVAVLGNTIEVQRYASASYFLIGGMSNGQATLVGWNNSIYNTNVSSVFTTLLYKFGGYGSSIDVKQNRFTSDPSEMPDLTASNMIQNTEECEVGVCKNFVQILGSDSATMTMATGFYGLLGDAQVSYNTVDVTTSTEAAVNLALGMSGLTRATIHHNTMTAKAASAKVVLVSSISDMSSLSVAENYVESTGPTQSPPTLKFSPSPCTELTSSGVKVCNNSVAAHAKGVSATFVDGAFVDGGVTAESNALEGVGLSNVTFVLLRSISSQYNNLIVRYNSIVSTDMAAFVEDEQWFCGTFCNNSAVSNPTSDVKFCQSCSVEYNTVLQHNTVRIAGGHQIVCSHCLFQQTRQSYPSDALQQHTDFAGTYQRALVPGAVDVVLMDGWSNDGTSGTYLTITDNEISVTDLNITVCSASEVAICPSTLVDANSVRVVVAAGLSVHGTLTVQSNPIVVQTLHDAMSSTIAVVQSLSLHLTGNSVIQNNPIQLDNGSVTAFVCAKCSLSIDSETQASLQLTLQNNPMELSGNGASVVLCLMCNVRQKLVVSSHAITVAGGGGGHSSVGFCIVCSCSNYGALLNVVSNTATFTNVEVVVAVIGMKVTGLDSPLMTVKNGIAVKQDGLPSSYSLGGCPGANLLLCNNFVYGEKVREANASICRVCRLTNATEAVYPRLTVSDNHVDITGSDAASILLADVSTSGAGTVCTVNSNTAYFRHIHVGTFVPFRASSSKSEVHANQNIFDFNDVSLLNGYLIGSSKGNGGGYSDTLCAKSNLVTSSSSGMAPNVGAPGCNVSVYSNTVRVYGGSTLDNWSLLGVGGSRSKYTFQSNSISSDLVFDTILSTKDPDTLEPSYMSNAEVLVTGNTFEGRNMSIGVKNGVKITILSSVFNFLTIYGEDTSYGGNTITLTNDQLEGVLLGGSLGSTSISLSGVTFLAEQLFLATSLSSVALNVHMTNTQGQATRRNFDVLQSDDISNRRLVSTQGGPAYEADAQHILYAENTTFDNTNFTVEGVNMDLSSGAVLVMKNTSIASSVFRALTSTIAHAGLMHLDNVSMVDSVVKVLMTTMSASNTLFFFPANCAPKNFFLNVTHSTFTSADIYGYNVAELSNASNYELLFVYDNSAFVGYNMFHNADANYRLQLACTTWEGISAYDMNRTSYFPYRRDLTLKLLSWALEVCFTRTPSMTFTKTVLLSLTKSPSLSRTPTFSNTSTPSTTVTPSITRSLSPTTSASPTTSVSPTVTLSLTPTTSLTPTVSLSPTPTLSPSPSPSTSPSASPSPSTSPSASPTPSPSPSDSPSTSPSPSMSPSPSTSPSVSPTRSPSDTISPTPTATPVPTPSSSRSPSSTKSRSPTTTPTGTESSSDNVTSFSLTSASSTLSLKETPTEGSDTATLTLSSSASPTRSRVITQTTDLSNTTTYTVSTSVSATHSGNFTSITRSLTANVTQSIVASSSISVKPTPSSSETTTVTTTINSETASSNKTTNTRSVTASLSPTISAPPTATVRLALTSGLSSTAVRVVFNGTKWSSVVATNTTYLTFLLRQSIANALGMPIENVVILEMTVGSLIVRFQVTRNNTYAMDDATLVQAVTTNTAYEDALLLYQNVTNETASLNSIEATSVSVSGDSDDHASLGVKVGVPVGVVCFVLVVAAVYATRRHYRARKALEREHEPSAS